MKQTEDDTTLPGLSPQPKGPDPATEPPGSPDRRGQLLRRSSTVSALTGLGVGAGFAVDVLIVARFGMGGGTDAFFGGYTIPFVLITAISAIQPVLVTSLSAVRHDEAAFGILLNATALVSGAIAALGVLAARPLIEMTTPGFTPATTEQAASLARLLFARVPMTAIAEVCKAELYRRRRFGLATFSNVLPSAVTLALLLAVGSGARIEIVAYGFIAGSFAQAALLAVSLFGRLRLPYHWTLRHSTPILRETGQLLVAPLTGLLLRQGVTLAERFFGSYLPAGGVTALSYASRLAMTVAGVSLDGIMMATLPPLAEQWTEENFDAARAEVRALFKLAISVALPAGLALAALGTPLVRLFFQRGQVDLQSAILMGTVFSVYSLSLVALGPFRAAQIFFYAARRASPVVVLHGALALLTILLDAALVWAWGAAGLALAFSISCGIISAVALLWLVRWDGDPMGLSGQSLGRSWLVDLLWRMGLSSGAMAVALHVASRSLGASLSPWGRWGLLIQVTLSGLVGLAVLIGTGTLLRVEAISILRAALKRRTGNRPRAAG